jgi:hypothetical protein
MLDSLVSDVTGVTFRAHLSKGAVKGCQSILPRSNGTFPAIQLPLLGKELPLQHDGHRICRSRSPTTINEQTPASQQRSKPRQAPAQSKDPPDRWRCPTGGGIRPCSTERRLAAIAVGAPTARTFAVISPTSHHRQWSGASFKINDEERQFLSQLTEDQKCKVSDSAPHYLYRRGN